uniref:tRNA-intron lyase n=1 Tax=Albugo laibachii Nc14 TaxID=890382 RepID=F0X0E8_9STRA|nr:AlNc14C481G11889 [Albugo laibachii Nc14]|eukprot:CCA27235.1 AlNc14C481G11889 [Albugo laibachii Nc14]
MGYVTGIDSSIVLTDKHDIERLQMHHRIIGSPIYQPAAKQLSNPCALRLGLEEIVVGILHHFMRLRCRQCGCEHGKTNDRCFESQEGASGGSTSHVLIQTDCQVIFIFENILEMSMERKQDACIVESLHHRRDEWEAVRLRSSVFADLWEKEYFVAFGSKFGADYITYKENPRCGRPHAVAMVLVMDYEDPFDILHVASHCRIGKKVQKRVYFASRTPENIITYIALEHVLFAPVKR